MGECQIKTHTTEHKSRPEPSAWIVSDVKEGASNAKTGKGKVHAKTGHEDPEE
jgi:hypothetical protein